MLLSMHKNHNILKILKKTSHKYSFTMSMYYLHIYIKIYKNTFKNLLSIY